MIVTHSVCLDCTFPCKSVAFTSKLHVDILGNPILLFVFTAPFQPRQAATSRRDSDYGASRAFKLLHLHILSSTSVILSTSLFSISHQGHLPRLGLPSFPQVLLLRVSQVLLLCTFPLFKSRIVNIRVVSGSRCYCRCFCYCHNESYVCNG